MNNKLMDDLNNVPVLMAFCDVGVMSRFQNSAHHARMNCWTASVVVRETKSFLGVNCSESKCTLPSLCTP